MRIRPKPISISNSREQAITAYLMVLGTLYLGVLFVFIVDDFIYRYFAFLNIGGESNPLELIDFAIFYTSTILLLILAMRWTGQNRGSVGLTRHGLGSAIAMGLALSGILFALTALFAPLVGSNFQGFSMSSVYSFLAFSIVGPSEEVVWRGFVQTRLVSYHGPIRGLIVSSLLFASYHIPNGYFESHNDPLGTPAFALLRFAGGIVFGYTMMRSQSIASSAILHTFSDWILVLFGFQT